MSMPRRPRPLTAASRHIGTIRITASGSVQLSYWAASTRNTQIAAATNTSSPVLPAWRSCSASSVHS